MTPMQVAKAYAAAQGQVSKVSSGGTTGEPGFDSILQSAVSNAMNATKSAETQMSMHAQGKTELVDAVTAVASAEVTLETMIAVRDQVITAYQEILRMPI
ncbi:MAG: flagellar hook-basal body complex protein FliE [Asticcacaulis sp.]